MSLRISTKRNSNVTFSGNYSRTVAVKTSDKNIPRPATLASRASRQYLADPRRLEVAVLNLAPMQVQSRIIHSEKCARNRLFAASVEH